MEEEILFRREQAGVCPKCKGSELQYEDPEHDGDGQLIYRFRCEDCNAQGEEVYEVEYLESIIRKNS